MISPHGDRTRRHGVASPGGRLRHLVGSSSLGLLLLCPVWSPQAAIPWRWYGPALVQALLRMLGPAAHESPRATFHCVAVLALPDGRSFEGEGILSGTIAAEPRGTGGFGFDPVFRLSDGRILAELSMEEKNTLSHRARALNALEVHGAFDAALLSERSA